MRIFPRFSLSPADPASAVHGLTRFPGPASLARHSDCRSGRSRWLSPFRGVLGVYRFGFARRLRPTSRTRGGLVDRAADWPWSSARAHAWGEADSLLSPTQPFPGPVIDWWGWLVDGLREKELYNELRVHTRTGRPLGSPGFPDHFEGLLNRVLHRQKVGRKTKKETK